MSEVNIQPLQNAFSALGDYIVWKSESEKAAFTQFVAEIDPAYVAPSDTATTDAVPVVENGASSVVTEPAPVSTDPSTTAIDSFLASASDADKQAVADYIAANYPNG